MEIWYKAWGHTIIDPVEVVRVNDKTLVIRVERFTLDSDLNLKGSNGYTEERVVIRNEYATYFRTRNEALAFLEARAAARVVEISDMQAEAMADLRKLRNMERD